MSSSTKVSSSGAASRGLVRFCAPMVVVRSLPGGAEQKELGAVGGPHRGGVRESGQPLERAVLGAGEFLGAIGAQQVGAGGGVHDQRAAGEHPEFPAVVEQEEGQMLVGVAGGGECPQGQPAQVGLVAVRQAPVLEGTPAAAAEASTVALGCRGRVGRRRRGSRRAGACRRRRRHAPARRSAAALRDRRSRLASTARARLSPRSTR
ncbi:hypothetical protein ACSCBZ_22275 [Streptomyces niveiscabiei]|uniref:hypothetical protein n=1 Tax=Streptomyces niveiscabiei TaxID=164115 RepID=UPI003EBF3020